ncbi:MAG: hypothetical protein ABF317_05040 [Bacteroidia bacterium]
MRRCSTYFAKDPKQLFLVDALGAALSAVLLGVVLVNYEPIFGIPSDSLSLLAAVPYFFAVYDVVCYFALTINLPTALEVYVLHGRRLTHY